MTSLPHSYDEDPEDPNYNVSNARMRKRLTNHTRLLQHFQTRWKREYLTSLREFHKASGTNMQRVKVGDIVLIHNKLHWILGVVDSLILGNDGLIHAENVKTNNQVTSKPISRLYPLEVSLHHITSWNTVMHLRELSALVMMQEIVHSRQQQRGQELVC